MPDLMARMDNAGWLTPAMADVLDPLPPLPYDDAAAGRQAKTIERALGEAEASAKVVSHVPLPSHALFVLQPGEVGRLRSRRQVTVDDVRAAMPKVAAALEAEAVDLIESLQRAPGALGLMVRGAEHRPLAPRTLLMQPAFQEHRNPASIVFGLNMQQAVILHDLSDLPHLLILGASAAKTHFIHTMLATLMLFNTPTELQVALVGSTPATFQDYTGSPHLVGPPLSGMKHGTMALQRMVKEISRREQLLSQQGADDLDAYNSALSSDDAPLPRMVLVIDSISDETWSLSHERWDQALKDRASWAPGVGHMLMRGARVGLHLFAVSDAVSSLPAGAVDTFPTRLVLRSAAAEAGLPPMKGLPTRFVDAVLLSGDDEPIALELAAIPPGEIKAVVGYWQQMAEKRTVNAEQRAAEAAAPGTGPLAGPGTGPLAEPRLGYEVGAEAPPPLSASEQVLEYVVPRARALAAYLGWLGEGPLRDVLGLNEAQAQNVMDQLKAEGLLEPKIAPVLRYQRLTPPPDDAL
jgi:hypothetical protein